MKLVKVVASELKISKSVIKEMIRNKKISFELRDGTYYVDAQEVDRCLNKKEVPDDGSIIIEDALFLGYINSIYKDFKRSSNKKNPQVKSLLKDLHDIKVSKKFSVQTTFDLMKYLYECLNYEDYTSHPEMEIEHQYMYDYMSKYFNLEAVGTSGGYIYSPSTEAEAILPLIKSQLQEKTNLSDEEMIKRIDEFMRLGMSIEELGLKSVDDLFR